MKPIKRSELFPGNLIRIYYKDTPSGPWGWIQGRVIDNGPTGRVAQIRVIEEKKSYPDDASTVGHAIIVQADDLIFKVEVEDGE